MSDAEIKASLPLQVLLYFHKPVAIAFFVLNVLLFLYKGNEFPYPPSRLAVEVVAIFLYLPVQWLVIFIASMGNKLERIPATAVGICCQVPLLVFHIYFFDFQTYVLRLDQICNLIAVVMVAFEIVFGIVAAVTFWRFGRY